LYPELCTACNELLKESEATICTQCQAILPKTEDWESQTSDTFHQFNSLYPCSIVSSFLYLSKNSKVEHLLYQLKYRGKYEIGYLLGFLYGKALADSSQFTAYEYEWIIPVPLHKKRLKKRGYNQSKAISEGLSAATGISINEDICKRIHATRSQTFKDKFSRIHDMDSVFKVVKPELLTKGCNVLIVDDVITTGATIDALCKHLYETGLIQYFGILSIAKK